MVDTKHPLATYLRVMGATVTKEVWPPRMSPGKKLRAIDWSLLGDVFQASVCRELLGRMSASSRRRAKPSPEDYLRTRFAVRLREYCEVGAEEYGEHVRDWAAQHGADVLRKLEEPWVLGIWEEISSQPKHGPPL
jgi:hypothetical protein